MVCIYGTTYVGLSGYTTAHPVRCCGCGGSVISRPPDLETIRWGCAKFKATAALVVELWDYNKIGKMTNFSPTSVPFSKNRSGKSCSVLCVQEQKIPLCISLKRKINHVLCLFPCLAQQEVESKFGSEV